MSQKLTLPFAQCRVAAAYKLTPYRQYWGYDHYGIDYKATAALEVLASGDGIVVTAGNDTNVGNTVCVVYRDVHNHAKNTDCDLVARYMHLKSISVKEGQTVKAGDVLGIEGKTGGGGWSEHLHVEFDTDIDWPNHSPQVKGSNLIKKGVDTTVDPSGVFYRGPDQLIVNGGNPGWTSTRDWQLPIYEPKSEVDILRERVVQLEHELAQQRDKYAGLVADINEMVKKYQ
jgi:murein DD-endopeptidase MepM/ murein hydrolase activator NlpD